MVNRTGMLMPLVPGALMATAALKVPGFKPTGFTITCRLPGKLPAMGLTLSQALPVLSLTAAAVKFVTLEFELDRLMVCDVAAVLPDGTTKLNEFGFAEIGLDTPPEFAFSVTGTDRFTPPEEMLTKPT